MEVVQTCSLPKVDGWTDTTLNSAPVFQPRFLQPEGWNDVWRMSAWAGPWVVRGGFIGLGVEIRPVSVENHPASLWARHFPGKEMLAALQRCTVVPWRAKGFPLWNLTLTLCPPIFEPTGAKPNWLVVPKHAMFPTWKRMKCYVSYMKKDCPVWQKFTGSFEFQRGYLQSPFPCGRERNVMHCRKDLRFCGRSLPFKPTRKLHHQHNHHRHHYHHHPSLYSNRILKSLLGNISYGASPMWVKEVVTTKARSSKWRCLLSDMLADISSSRSLHMSVSC